MNHPIRPFARSLSILLLAAVLCPGAALALEGQDAAPAPDPDRQAIADAWAGYRDALMKKDAAAIAALFTEDGALLAPGMPDIKGRKTLEGFLLAGFSNAKVTDASGTTLELHVYGSAAYELGTYTQTVENLQGESRTSSGRYAAFWVKGDDGHWRIRRILLNRLPPPQADSSEPAPEKNP